jgi:hypothetical protein
LTRLRSESLPLARAIDQVREMAAGLGWHPVGDVLLTALERCRDRSHLRCDKQRLVITARGRRWLAANRY